MTREEIEGLRSYRDIFNSSKEENKRIYKEIVKEWHPDRYMRYGDREKIEEAELVMRKINKLYEEYKNSINRYKEKTFKTLEGKEVRMKYIKEEINEIGVVYIGKRVVVYEIGEDKRKYYDNYRKIVEGFRYGDEKMREEMEKYLPIGVKYKEIEGGALIIIDKGEEYIRLKDIIENYGERMTGRVMSWIISSLYNIVCYYEWSKKVQNGITEDNVYITMKNHASKIIGGYWYSGIVGERMIGCKKETYEIMPFKNKRDKENGYKTDLESIRLIGRKMMNKVREVMKEYFKSVVVNESAIEEYRLWNKVLDKAYGKKREFVKMEVTNEEIYNL